MVYFLYAGFYSPLSSLGPFIVMFVVILIKPTGLYGVAGKAFGFEEQEWVCGGPTKKRGPALARRKGVFMPGGIKWSEMEWEEVNEHISRKVVMEDRLMMVLYRFDPHQAWPAEVHEAEQGGYILQGKIELNLPAEGKKILLGPGDGYLIGTKVPHSWETLEEETVLLDVFSPPRRELFQKKFAPQATE